MPFESFEKPPTPPPEEERPEVEEKEEEEKEEEEKEKKEIRKKEFLESQIERKPEELKKEKAERIKKESQREESCNIFRSLSQEEREVVLEVLPPRSRRVIALSFGLEGEGPMTLEEIALREHRSRELIRQTESRALRRFSRFYYSKRHAPTEEKIEEVRNKIEVLREQKMKRQALEKAIRDAAERIGIPSEIEYSLPDGKKRTGLHPLPRRALNALWRNGIHSFEQTRGMSDAELLNLRHLGLGTLRLIREAEKILGSPSHVKKEIAPEKPTSRE